MDKRLLAFWILLVMGIQGFGQNRTIDGTSNNLQNTNWGSAGNQIRTITSNGFIDGISAPGGVNRPNPRIISNTIFAQDSLINDVMALSDFTWVFGQFIDHDVVSSSNDPTEDASIDVDFPDPYFNPGGAFPFIQISMFRSLERPGTGTSTINPRGYTNNITSWIDASNVYGSDIDRANYLRTFSGGKLKTSSGNLLPFNTDTYEYGGTIDVSAPHMDNENPFNDQLFVAGDTRANENVALSSFHTIFVREHNRLCDELALTNPGWDDEQLYQHARKMVGGYIQSIVYNEWLPVMGVHLPNYNGYNSNIDATITNVFATAAFRLGHTLLSGTILRMDNLGNTIPEGNLTLLEAFFTPYELVQSGGLDPIFKGMASQVQQKMDCKMVNDVRNFLFGPPTAGLGGLDLASININRGRERGLPDFNTIRQDLGLTPYTSFAEINADSTAMTVMENLYNDINDIDPWVGMLAEDHMPEALFGPTIMKILEDQFYALREGDRFYYENDDALTEVEKEDIRNTTFRDIIMRNTGITVMQMNVFEAMPHDSICPAQSPMANILGEVKTFDGDLVEGVDVNITYQDDGSFAGEFITEQSGTYMVEDLATCDHYDISAEKNYNAINGVSTFDMLFIQRHILEVELFDNAYKALSADVNNDGNITTLDMVEMRKVILALQDTFTYNKSWRFVDEGITYADPNHPVEAILDQSQINYLPGDSEVNFVGLKIGDVTGNADPAALIEDADTRDYPATFTLYAQDKKVESGNNYSFSIEANEFETLAGMQFTLQFDSEALSINEVIPGDVSNISDANFAIHKEKGAVSVSWDTENSVEGNLFFTVNITSKEDGELSDFITLNSLLTKAEAYSSELEIMNVDLAFENSNTVSSTAFEVYQNTPNPFNEKTTVSFNLPATDQVELVVYDLSGKILYVSQNNFGGGFNTMQIDKSNLKGSGILYYQLNTSFGSKTNKMILME
jgi:heme peroxidase/type IX secretion system substrate protein/dockerin type I repeat protein